MRARPPPARRLHVGLFAVLLGCNAVLDNDPRTFDPDAEEGAGGSGFGGDVAGDDDAAVDVEGTGGATSGGAGQRGDVDDDDDASLVPDVSTGPRVEDSSPAGDARASEATPAAETGARVDAGAPRDAARDVSDATDASDAGPDADAGPLSCQVATRACSPGQVGSEQAACGSCLTGRASRTRTCLADCTWGPWSALGACVSTEACVKGAVQTRTVACACGGTKSQARTCSTTCAWGAYTDTSSCNLACCATVVFCDTPNNLAGVPASRGTWCRQTSSACTHAEVMTNCIETLASVDCVVHPELFIDYL
jgi:hypothetical protein